MQAILAQPLGFCHDAQGVRRVRGLLHEDGLAVDDVDSLAGM